MIQQQNSLYYTIDVKFFVYYTMTYVDKIFVYGNSKQDQITSNSIDHVEYIGKAETITKFNMYNLGGYPGVAINQNSGYKILGDLYTVTEAQIDYFDQLKGEGVYFERILEEIFIINNIPERNGTLVNAWIYILPILPLHYDESNIFLTTKNYLTYERI